MQIGKSFGLVMLNIKKCNLFLIGTVFLLLLVSILVGIKVLFSNMQGFEWGSVTDWFSAISTLAGSIASFGTLYIAYKAFQKAPEWLSQKHYDVVHGIIENAIYKELHTVRFANRKLKVQSLTASRNLKRALLHKEKELAIINAIIESLESSIDDLFSKAYSIIDQLKSISRNGYATTPYTNSIIDELKNATNSYNDIYMNIITVRAEIELLYEADQVAIDLTVVEINDIENSSLEIGAKLDDFLSRVFDNNKPVADFAKYKNNH
ncbi:TPA: hypothetical protein ACPYV3_002834 [Citrobacter freundii]|uniref:Uncharacterized protein n=2 Tax=Citrobacter freundii TaxID=546 RepID=A0AAD2PLM2_CITFR|nr:hypothetical protein [Citrobacter freundii]EJG2170961.1 hypothetical protein [Citrobacter freundii 47N]AXZ47390.1 hypothetical protein AM363_10710 [Citrobacter freundii]EKT9386391.1 hypothetical protein [Citrobacter freundii]EKU1806926.1 hypothetical protein [Citrobacter freundii]EKU8473247.1 hypothetical protein [Citrobacter freundii]